ncbi:MAG: hypothetical protein OEV99_05255 [Nitrospira sp.]|nr:hypothetical protein [Nitrospira sp.]MDH4369233.1 hypothetical protein [Nitrospira sp.]MDH5496683.1 hypothetical protein [Nitrospira sp.]MDH5724255.1 hypothetical protein [Nitrospira sp.]
MSNLHDLYDRYQAAWRAYRDTCTVDAQSWHRPDVAEFTELRRLLLPHAESGDITSQYALATILWMGFCCESEEQFVAGHAAAMEEATRWWLAAARQGYWPALDNLVTSGVGAEAKRTSEAWNQLEKERGDLVGSSHGMTVYGPEFVQELSRRLFGRVIRDEDGLKVEMERGI